MSEPLTKAQLRDCAACAWPRNDTNLNVTLAVRALLDEVERLKAERAAFVALAEEVVKERRGQQEWCADRLLLRQMAFAALIPSPKGTP